MGVAGAERGNPGDRVSTGKAGARSPRRRAGVEKLELKSDARPLCASCSQLLDQKTGTHFANHIQIHLPLP